MDKNKENRSAEKKSTKDIEDKSTAKTIGQEKNKVM
jgi:hypothetical protein